MYVDFLFSQRAFIRKVMRSGERGIEFAGLKIPQEEATIKEWKRILNP